MDSLWNDVERAAVEGRLREAVVGSDSTVKGGLEKVIADTGADEVIVVTDTWDHLARLDSYRRVAQIAAEIEIPATSDVAS